MHFGQKTHPLNFEYGSRLAINADSIDIAGDTFSARIHCADITDGCTRLRFDNAKVLDKRNYSDGILEGYRQGRPVQPQPADASALLSTASGTFEIGPARLKVRMNSGAGLETVADGMGFNGEKFILTFNVTDASGFYGFGERTKRLNKRGDSLDFWTIDVVAILRHTYHRHDYDPTYVAVPFAILKAGGLFTGLYFDNPGRVVMDVEHSLPGQFSYQSVTGNTDLYFIDGPRLRDVVRRFTQLTGRAPLPPLWSLGYHQSRWGYQREADFIELKNNFERFAIPVSALWHDIDYMDGYRLFTWDNQDYPAPAALHNQLKEKGIRTMAIIDPGVKREAGYPVYDSGHEYFCKTASGREFVGRAWPGDVVFPDFTLASTRDWWADWLAAFLEESAVDGVWLDMNDPATGDSDPDDMLFEHGDVPHDRYHNQYAHFMAKASLQAFTQLNPDGRPFLLTRSGFTGTQRYCALWTGDNASNWQHLRMSIPNTLNLGLSGIAFNGPDVGGHMEHTTAELMVRWYQAGFLFPFFRNHSNWIARPQEPWQFGPDCMAHIHAAISTRYRLLPYLYTCFFHHYLTGDPILRPLLYEYDGEWFDNLDDQFLVGDALMVAPIVDGDRYGHEIVKDGKPCQLRHILFPAGWWFDLNQGKWLQGGGILPYTVAFNEVPLFMRDGAVIPYYQGILNNSLIELNNLELHIFSKAQPGKLTYFIDDQQTRAYQAGHYTTVQIEATLGDGELQVTLLESGDYPTEAVNFTPVLYGCQGEWRAVITRQGTREARPLKPAHRPWLCKSIPVLA